MKGFHVIVHSLKKEPHRWEINQIWARHDSGLLIWIGSGFLNCRIEKPEYEEFGILERWHLYRAIRHIQKQKT